MSPQPGVGNTGPVWDPWPLSLMMESTSTVSCTYGLLTEEVRWQMVSFSRGAPDADDGQEPTSTRLSERLRRTAGRGAQCESGVPRFIAGPPPRQ